MRFDIKIINGLMFVGDVGKVQCGLKHQLQLFMPSSVTSFGCGEMSRSGKSSSASTSCSLTKALLVPCSLK